MSSLPSVNILGIKVSVIDLPELLAEIDRYASAGKSALVNNVNVHACNLAYEQSAFRNVLNASEIVFCDGFGVKIGARIFGERLGQRMTPPDWIDDLFRLCVNKGYSVFFVGDEAAVVELFADAVKGNYPDLKIAGCRDGFFDLDGEEHDRLSDQIKDSGADVIIAGMGMPRQELWAHAARDRIGKGVFIATGALFRWYTGYEKRAPRWMTDHGLEWFARFVVAPKRLFTRYAIGLPLFFMRIFRQRFGGMSAAEK